MAERKGNIEIGRRLRAYADSRNMHYQVLAEKLGSTGTNISNIMNGWSLPGKGLGDRIESLTGITARDWREGVGKPVKADPAKPVPGPKSFDVVMRDIISVRTDGMSGDCNKCIAMADGGGCDVLVALTGIDCDTKGVYFTFKPRWEPCTEDLVVGDIVRNAKSKIEFKVINPPIKAPGFYNGRMVLEPIGGGGQIQPKYDGFEVKTA